MNEIQQSGFIFATIMLVAGIGTPIMAALNAELGIRLQSPGTASSVLFLVGLLGSLIYLVIAEKSLPNAQNFEAPIYFYFGGGFVLLYVLSIAWVAPVFGVGNAIAFVLLGQLIAMATIDQFGLLGAPQIRLTPLRILGLILMAAGVLLVVRKQQKVVYTALNIMKTWRPGYDKE